MLASRLSLLQPSRSQCVWAAASRAYSTQFEEAVHTSNPSKTQSVESPPITPDSSTGKADHVSDGRSSQTTSAYVAEEPMRQLVHKVNTRCQCCAVISGRFGGPSCWQLVPQAQAVPGLLCCLPCMHDGVHGGLAWNLSGWQLQTSTWVLHGLHAMVVAPVALRSDVQPTSVKLHPSCLLETLRTIPFNV